MFNPRDKGTLPYISRCTLAETGIRRAGKTVRRWRRKPEEMDCVRFVNRNDHRQNCADSGFLTLFSFGTGPHVTIGQQPANPMSRRPSAPPSRRRTRRSDPATEPSSEGIRAQKHTGSELSFPVCDRGPAAGKLQ